MICDEENFLAVNLDGTHLRLSVIMILDARDSFTKSGILYIRMPL